MPEDPITPGTSPTDPFAPRQTERPLENDVPAGAPSLPSAGTEPEAQLAAAMGPGPMDDPADDADADDAFADDAPAGNLIGDGSPDLLPPSETYELPDEYAEGWLDRTRAWVEEHPALAIVAAAGIGLVVGRLLMGLAPEPEPPSLAERVEKRAKVLRKESKKALKSALKEARYAAGDAAGAAKVRLRHAADAVADAAETVADRAEHGLDRTKDLAETVADAVKVAVAGVVAKAADEFVKVKR